VLSEPIEDVFTGYLSVDQPPPSASDESDDDSPPAKRICTDLVIPACVVREKAQEACQTALQKGLQAIKKLIKSKKTKFSAGRSRIQAYRANAIQSHLQMVLNNGCKAIEASEIAAESQGFAQKWGGHLVRKWV
jgi:hypothetical protein